jgi:polyhydroxyalkanoate synthesis regulator phasin
MENFPLFELKAKLKEIEKRLSEDVITDMRFQSEIQEDKEKVKQLKRSIAILESNKY